MMLFLGGPVPYQLVVFNTDLEKDKSLLRNLELTQRLE